MPNPDAGLRRDLAIASSALAVIAAITLIEHTPGWWPAPLHDAARFGYFMTAIRAGLALLLGFALVRQWATPLRAPLGWATACVVLSLAAGLLFNHPSLAAQREQWALPWADLVLLAAYACLLISIIAMPSGTANDSSPMITAIDVTITVAAIVALVGHFLIVPTVTGGDTVPTLRLLTTLGYPAFDFGLLLVLLIKPRFNRAGPWRQIYLGLALAALLIFLGDALFGTSAYVLGNKMLEPWSSFAHRAAAAALLFVALRTLRPIDTRLDAPQPRQQKTLSPLSAIGVSVVLATMLEEALRDGHHISRLLVVSGSLLGFLAIFRQLMTSRSNVQLLKSQQQYLEEQVAARTGALAALNERLAQLAREDSLTELPNRRRFDEELEHVWANATRSGQPVAVALLDVDAFKAYNDHYGHPTGDACLRRVAGALKSSLRRSTDMAARYGGEEFVVLMPYTDLAGATALAEQLRGAVQALALDHATSPVAPSVTISVGVAAEIPTAKVSPAALLAAADNALYSAKRRGRNRVVSAS